MQNQLTEVWDKARAYYSAHLSDRERMKMEKVTSQEKLFQHLEALRANYLSQKMAKSLLKTHALVAQLRSFTQIINIFVQSNDIAAFVWGPLALIFELAYRHNESLEIISDVLERIEQALPRFHEYLKEFGSRNITSRFQEALVVYYSELIGHYQDSIKFLRAHPLRNVLLLSRPANKFNISANKRLQRLRDLTQWVEEEVHWLKYQTQQTQHKQVVQLLQTNQAHIMILQLPFRDFPYTRNVQFCFRRQLLKKMRYHLEPGQPKSTLRTAGLYGLGGVGKTQLALEFAYRHTHDFDAIFWIKAQTEAKIRESICAYGRAMQDNSQSGLQPDAVLINRFQSWLILAGSRGSKTGAVKWLVVFDNVEQISTLQHFWPAGAHGCVLVTTRDASVARHFGQQALEVPLFTSSESMHFMFKIHPTTERTSPAEIEAVKRIAERSDNLPLVLGSIGGYTSSISSSYEAFLQHYSDFDRNLIFQQGTSDTSSYEASISTTWTMTLSKIDPSAKDLMETIALFDPDSIPIDLLESRNIDDKMDNGPDDDFPDLDECLKTKYPNRQSTDKAISILLRGSLISRSTKGDRLSCHRIVREAVLRTLDSDKLPVMFDWALFALNALFPKALGVGPLFSDWDLCATYYSHLSSLVKLYHCFTSLFRPPILLCEIIRRCAWYLCERGSFADALDLTKTALKILEEAVTNSNHPGYYPIYMRRLTADMYLTAGHIEYELNISDHGRSWFEKADTHRRKLTEDDMVESDDIEDMAIGDTSIALSDLADTGKAQASITTFKFLIDNFHNESNRGIWATNLSVAYRFHDELQESLKWCQTALGWAREAFEDDSLTLAVVHFNTGNTHLAMKQDDQAFQAFDKALQIRQQKAATHRYTGFTCHKMGVLMRARGDIPAAIASFRSAERILNDCEAQTGALLRSKFALSKALKEVGVFAEADIVMQEVMSALPAIDSFVRIDDLTDDYFERFVLFCHR